MEIKDYLHLYIGCKALLMDYDSATGAPKEFKLSVYNLNRYYEWVLEIKPILRPLSDMRESEITECFFKGFRNYKEVGFFSPKEFRYLLSKHFDLFGLIEAGLAIDKTKTKSESI